MIAMTVGINSVRALLSKTSCLRHPADEHRHLRHGAMIWHTLYHIIERKAKLRGHCRVRTKFPSRTFVSLTSFSGNGGSKFRKRVLKFTGIFASTGLAPKSASLQRSGLAHPSANYRGSHCGKTRWKHSGSSSCRNEMARVASTRRIDEHLQTDGTHRP